MCCPRQSSESENKIKGKLNLFKCQKAFFFLTWIFFLFWLLVGGNVFAPLYPGWLVHLQRAALVAAALLAASQLASSYTKVLILFLKMSLQVRHSKQAVRSICTYQKIVLFRVLEGTGR